MALSTLVLIKKNEFQKTIFTDVLQLHTAYWGQYSTLKDLYTLYETSDKIEKNLHKNNIIVLTSKKSLDKRIIANMNYYHLL